MIFNIDHKVLLDILDNKTSTKLFKALLQAYDVVELDNPEVTGLSFSMDELRKYLKYANKSTVCRGLRRLASLNLFDMRTSSKGTQIEFNPVKVKLV